MVILQHIRMLLIRSGRATLTKGSIRFVSVPLPFLILEFQKLHSLNKLYAFSIFLKDLIDVEGGF